MSVQVTILGSGSGGNSAYVETPEARLLVDAGFSLRQIRQRLGIIGRAPEGLTGVLVTHEHSDHIHGLATMCANLDIPLYCNRQTKEAIEAHFSAQFAGKIFTTGASFDAGDVRVDTFSIPHDASDPVGFLLRTPDGNIGFLTDLGHCTKLVLERIRTANVLVLEANHDLKMLQESSRPWNLKQRIAGRHGHLSNTDAAAAAEHIMSAGLRQIYLGHLSRECNTPELAFSVVQERLQKIGADHVNVQLTFQNHPCPTLELTSLGLPDVSGSQRFPVQMGFPLG